ncbi:AT-rich interactive domain-containing protein 3-like [Triticum dicoccoides]|nr:AT-rich interactive domain-containing protein 3-like [Triticum dicoccoides]
MNDQNHLQPAPFRKDEEGSSLLKISNHSLMFDNAHSDEDSGTKEEQDNFMNELERFHKDNSMEFRPPKFYGEGLNYLKLWRKVKKLGRYKQVTLSRKWRQVGESFEPPKTCTNVSWSFHNFYKKKYQYQVYALVPGLLREELQVLSDPVGRLIITGEPTQLDNPWVLLASRR